MAYETTAGQVFTRPLSDWSLRNSPQQAQVNPHGSYGLPIIHRGACQGRYHLVRAPDWPPLQESEFEAFWNGELVRERIGLSRTIEFCGNCVVFIDH